MPTSTRLKIASASRAEGCRLVSILMVRSLSGATGVTSCSLWVMKITDLSGAGERPHDLEELRRLLRLQHRGRLVRDQNPHRRG